MNYTYDPQTGILNSIISSGQISYISNRELKYLLASLEDMKTDAFEDTDKIERWRDDLVTQINNAIFLIKDGRIIDTSFKAAYDAPSFRLLTGIYGDGVRGEGLTEELNLKETMQHILDLINSEII